MDSPSAPLLLFPAAHSCEFCQRFVLDPNNDIDWGPGSTDFPLGISRGKNTIKPSLRVQEWFNKDKMFRSRDSRSHMKAIAEHDFTLVFDCTLVEMKNATSKGCAFCRYILRDIKAEVPTGHWDTTWKVEDDTLFAAQFSSSSDAVHFGMATHTYQYEVNATSFSRGTEDKFPMFAYQNNYAALEVTSRPINPIPLSDKILHWTETCLNEHEKCSVPDESFVPTRLVEISNQQGHRVLRLIESNGCAQNGYKDPYCALSYCWGGEQLMATTRKTLQQYLSGIDMENLPQSIRDAILVTEKLGICRLWVDSLCIIQDDVADKDREIAQMPQVYGNATVTIAASRASEVEEGFLQERPILGLERPGAVFELPYRNHDGQLGSIIIVPQPIVPKIEVQPLDLRAWALQERLLSPRVIDFGPYQTSWFCQTHSLAKEIPTDGFLARTTSKEGDLVTASLLMLGQDNRTVPTPSSARNKIMDSWQAVVYAYTRRALTQPMDRPLAISGIASRFAKLLDSEYHAGLWEFAMASELLWYPARPRSRFEEARLKPRPRPYQGPSWSWFCISDTVEWLTAKAFCIEIVKIAIMLRNEKFGAITSAELTIKGKVLPAKWIPRAVVKQTGPVFFKNMTSALTRPDIEGNDGILEMTILPDAVFEDLDTPFHPVVLLQVTELEGSLPKDVFKSPAGDPNVYRLTGIVLRKNDDATYSRLGLYHLSTSNRDDEEAKWLQGGTLQVITLV